MGFDVLFNIVTFFIGIYIISYYILNINIIDNALRKLRIDAKSNMTVIFYIMLFISISLLAIMITFLFDINIINIYMFFLVPVIITLIITVLSLNLNRKSINPNSKRINRNTNYLILYMITGIIGAIDGVSLGVIIQSTLDSVLVLLIGLLLYFLMFLSCFLLVGRLSIIDGKEVYILFSNNEIANFITNNQCFSSNCIKADLIYEDGESVYITYNSKNYRISKDQVMALTSTQLDTKA